MAPCAPAAAAAPRDEAGRGLRSQGAEKRLAFFSALLGLSLVEDESELGLAGC